MKRCFYLLRLCDRGAQSQLRGLGTNSFYFSKMAVSTGCQVRIKLVPEAGVLPELRRFLPAGAEAAVLSSQLRLENQNYLYLYVCDVIAGKYVIQ